MNLEFAGKWSSARPRPLSAGVAFLSRDPDAALDGLETHPDRIGTARYLRATADFAVGEIGSNQIDEARTGLPFIGLGQRVREDACLNVVASRQVTDDAALESIEHDQHRVQCVVRHIAGPTGVSDEAQMQQSAHAAA